MSRRVMQGFFGMSLVIAVALAGCSSGDDAGERTTATGDPASTPTPTEEPSVIEVDGTRVWVQCQGAGEPTIVLEAGSDSQGSTDFPAELIDDLAVTNRTCTYDRPGTGMSGRPAEEERTVDDVNRLLRHVLKAADVSGPYVLAGNSGGGILSIEFARRYRDEMAGLVLLDVPGPQRDLDPTLQGVSPETNTENMDWVELEHRLAVDPPDLGDLPVVIVTATFGQSDVKDQAYWLALSSSAEQVELEGDHAIQMSAPTEVADLISSVS